MKMIKSGLFVAAAMLALSVTAASAENSGGGSIPQQVTAARKVLGAYNSLGGSRTQLTCPQLAKVFVTAHPRGSATVPWFTPQDAQQAQALGYSPSDWSTILNTNRVVDHVTFALAAGNCAEVTPPNNKCCEENPLPGCKSQTQARCYMTADGQNCTNGSTNCS
jgi:hypothetical protein